MSYKTTNKILAILFLVPLILTACSSAPAVDGYTAGLQDILDDQLQAANVPGGILAVDTPDNGLIILSTGVTDVETNTPFEPTDRFNIASATKTFIAVLILQLVEEEKLSLDDTLDQFIPDFPYAAEFTVRDLLAHRTGLVTPDEMNNYVADAIQDLSQKWTWRQSADYAGEEDLLFEPGTRYSYSNANYSLLVGIIEAVTGNPFHQELRSKLFDPFELHNTHVSGFEEIPGDYVHGFIRCSKADQQEQAFMTQLYGAAGECTDWGFSTEKLPRTTLETFQIGATGIVSDGQDLVRWAKLLYGGEILEAHSLIEMLTLEPDSAYGLGVETREFSNGVGVGHSGGGPGETQMWYFQDTGITIVTWYLSPMQGDIIDEVVAYLGS